MAARMELVWDGKYEDEARTKRRKPLRVDLPFQTVETVNEPSAQRRDLFTALDAEKPWRNRLIWGDKKYVLPSLLKEFAGKVDLIYIDPPFDTGADFSFNASMHTGPDDEDGASFTKLPSLIELKAYRDIWGHGIDSYLQWFYETAQILHELLADTGSIYVHLDWHIGHHVKVILDEVFGEGRFTNCIVWKRSDAHSDAGQGATHLGKVCDNILFYCKSPDKRKINTIFTPLPVSTADKWYRHIEEGSGRRYNKADVTGPGGATKGNPVYEWNGVTKAWRYSKTRMAELHQQGKLVYSSSGMTYQKRYLDESKGVPIQDLWDDIGMIRGIHTNSEGLGYATQKPEALLDRIIQASSNEGDLVLDCFCGSGTTAAVAEKLGRRWITCDLGRFAVHTARKRLLNVQNVTPFVVQNLGKYERQQWQAGQFADAAEQDRVQRAYTDFILKLYHAEPVAGYSWLHGKKGERFVHVGTVDGPVTDGDVKKIVAEFKRAMGTGPGAPTTNGIDVLGWDFAFELNEELKQQAAAANVLLRFKRLPNDVMDKRAVAQGDIHFFEMAALEVTAKVTGRTVAVTLAGFTMPPDDVPEDVRGKVTHWSQWVDFWAVDFHHENQGTFHNEWQAFRTKAAKKLDQCTTFTYADPGDYRVMVKVIDILGNDTTKTLTVKVK